jgi:hypothetical protein
MLQLILGIFGKMGSFSRFGAGNGNDPTYAFRDTRLFGYDEVFDVTRRLDVTVNAYH